MHMDAQLDERGRFVSRKRSAPRTANPAPDLA